MINQREYEFLGNIDNVGTFDSIEIKEHQGCYRNKPYTKFVLSSDCAVAECFFNGFWFINLDYNTKYCIAELLKEEYKNV